MKAYWVKGLYRPGKRKKNGKGTAAELFAQVVWANNPQEALQQATVLLEGGEWLENPEVGLQTEEQRMRKQGAPELPGFGAPPKPKKRR